MNNRQAAINESQITGFSILKTLGLWIVLSSIIGIASWYLAATFDTPSWRTAQVPTLLVVVEVYAILPLAMLITYGGFIGLRNRVKFRYTGWRDICLAVIVFVGANAIVLFIFMGMGLISGSLWHPGQEFIHDATDISRFKTANVMTWILIFLRVFFLAGLGEELLFRGLLFGWLRQKYSAPLTILIVSVIFMFEHVYPIIFPAVFVYGIILGWLRERTSSVLPGLIVHILTDSLLFLLAYILFRYHIVV